MELLTPELKLQLLRNFRNKDADHVPVVKFFTPWANATWIISDLDQDDQDTLFGLCDLGLGEPELGYVLLSDLEEIRGPGGLRVERDLHWYPTKPLSAYMSAAKSARRIVEPD